MKVVGLMVTRNEAGRYLECALTHLAPFVDQLVVFDDGSDDDTVAVCRRFTPWVGERVAFPDVPTFLEHEGRFRHAAWRYMKSVVPMAEKDWVFCVDADEIVVANERSAVRELAKRASAAGADTAAIPIPEAFQLDPIAVRTDRLWANQRTPRLFRWEHDALFTYELMEDFQPGLNLPPMAERPGASASGSGPLWDQALKADHYGVQLLHAGYADAADRVQRHARYWKRRGHNPAHIASILERPRLELWPGPPLEIWRGVRPVMQAPTGRP